MRTFIKNNPNKSIIFILVLFPILIHSVNKVVGFCFEKGRILSDEEMIEMMLDSYYKNEIKLDPADTSIKTYVANHPKCCRILKGKSDPYYHGIGMLTYETVYISYPIREDALGRYAGAKYYEKLFAVNQCGKGFESAGFGSRKPE